MKLSLLRPALFGFAFLSLFTMNIADAGLWPCRANVQRYRGNWVSDCNGHHGTLNARVVQKDCQTYRVTFTGTFLAVVPFAYSTPMTVTGHCPDGSVQLHGHSLLPLFGDFDCRANMSHCHFSACYQSRRDHGQFHMSRQ